MGRLDPKQLARQRAHRQRTKDWVNAQKSAPCVDCGGVFHHSAMDFDHISGEKEGAVSHMARQGYAIASVAAEIAKCVLRCANCHRVRHYQETHDD